jgi:diacylglycerol kinase (ATP)
MRRFAASRVRSFGHAFEGWWYVLRTQRNARVHAIIALAVLGLSFWLQLDALRWAVILLTMVMVFAAEFFNTAIEAVVDLASPHEHPLAKVGKDVAAAAVLIAALGAALIGMLVLGQPLLLKIQSLIGR